ncbi:restriction endonuclease [Amycolatopsis bartoniae]|nr:restriction endonuclease [Amycolatopsis bartoniae]
MLNGHLAVMRHAVPMGRVEWTRIDGEDVEAVVAMFVNRERPNSARITPSRGDGGVDILERAAAPGGRDAVYQVKRYTEPVTARQKDEIENSLERLFTDPRWANLDVGVWYLVTPWDPSPEAENWYRGSYRIGISRLSGTDCRMWNSSPQSTRTSSTTTSTVGADASNTPSPPSLRTSPSAERRPVSMFRQSRHGWIPHWPFSTPTPTTATNSASVKGNRRAWSNAPCSS